MNDTPPEIENRIIQMIAARTPEERLRMASSMFDAARELMRAGLLREDPSLNEAQLRARMFVRMYGDCFTREEIERIVNRIPDMDLGEDFVWPKTVRENSRISIDTLKDGETYVGKRRQRHAGGI